MPYVTRLNAASRSNVFDTRQATNWAWPSLMAPTAWSSLALVQAYADQLGLSVSASAEGGLLTITLSGPVNGLADEPAQAL